MVMTFTNSFDHKIETEYLFPISTLAVFHSFSAEFEDGSRIIGTVKEKQAAKQEYQEAVATGH